MGGGEKDKLFSFLVVWNVRVFGDWESLDRSMNVWTIVPFRKDRNVIYYECVEFHPQFSLSIYPPPPLSFSLPFSPIPFYSLSFFSFADKNTKENGEIWVRQSEKEK